MVWWFQRSLMAHVCATILVLGLSGHTYAKSQTAQTGAEGDAQVIRTVGTIKSSQGDTLTLTSDSGAEVTAKLSIATKILRVPPGEKDLKNATPLQAQDLQQGDRVLVRGQTSVDGHSISALAVIVMKQADVSAKQEHDREDWQKRGVGGLVSAIDTTAGTITVSSAGLGSSRNVTVHITKNTTARRYASGSVRFDDAQPSSPDQIKPGDQLRARGTRSADGSELAAEEIVFGTFRNLAGTITAIDSASNSMTVQDGIGKSSVIVRVAPDSQIKKLPVEMAQRIALRLKGNSGEDGQGAARPAQSSTPNGNTSAEGQSSHGPGGMQGKSGNGAPDLQRFLGRMPSSRIADLQKGDAVMIVSTLGTDSNTVTAITVLAGVEPILTAAPNRSAAMLSPWTLGGATGEAEAP
jgi:Domain of unknown function (DUF5666)